MVNTYQTELLPVAAELTARLVSFPAEDDFHLLTLTPFFFSVRRMRALRRRARRPRRPRPSISTLSWRTTRTRTRRLLRWAWRRRSRLSSPRWTHPPRFSPRSRKSSSLSSSLPSRRSCWTSSTTCTTLWTCLPSSSAAFRPTCGPFLNSHTSSSSRMLSTSSMVGP